MKWLLLLLLIMLPGCSSMPEPETGARLVKSASAHEREWSRLMTTVKSPPSPFVANIEFVENRGKSAKEILAALPADHPYAVIFVADETTFRSPERSCLVIDLIDKKHPRFRALPGTLAQIENNLSTANMDFSEFADKAQETGVFRGF